MPKFALIGGPFDGQTIEQDRRPSSLILTGDGVPEGMVARYRPTRAPGALRFREYDRIVGTLPMPKSMTDESELTNG